jgi:hypothetical protein
LQAFPQVAKLLTGKDGHNGMETLDCSTKVLFGRTSAALRVRISEQALLQIGKNSAWDTRADIST